MVNFDRCIGCGLCGHYLPIARTEPPAKTGRGAPERTTEAPGCHDAGGPDAEQIPDSSCLYKNFIGLVVKISWGRGLHFSQACQKCLPASIILRKEVAEI